MDCVSVCACVGYNLVLVKNIIYLIISRQAREATIVVQIHSLCRRSIASILVRHLFAQSPWNLDFFVRVLHHCLNFDTSIWVTPRKVVSVCVFVSVFFFTSTQFAQHKFNCVQIVNRVVSCSTIAITICIGIVRKSTVSWQLVYNLRNTPPERIEIRRHHGRRPGDDYHQGAQPTVRRSNHPVRIVLDDQTPQALPLRRISKQASK